MVDPPVTNATIRVLLATTEILSGKVVGGTVVPTMASLIVVQVMARVLSTMVELLVVEVTRETLGEADEQGEAAASVLALAEVAIHQGYFPWQLEIATIVSFRTPCLVPAKYLTRCPRGPSTTLPSAYK